jgi:orotidine-5'-phosphate decarboxylase
MTTTELYKQIQKKNSFLCIGLDSDINKIPKHLLKFSDPVFEFNRQIIDATHDLAISYKPNTAFYECRGSEGWESLEKTADYIKMKYPDIFLIADAKRGDIGNTSQMYADAFFRQMPFDAVTVAPYMGEDSVKPFLSYPGKFVILLALTSNSGTVDFQMLKTEESKDCLYKIVLRKAKEWGSAENLMFVAGATKAEKLSEIREIVPEHFLLVPGVGVQGGSLKETVENGMNSSCGLIVNASRSIIFADDSKNFADSASKSAEEIQKEMSAYL